VVASVVETKATLEPADPPLDLDEGDEQEETGEEDANGGRAEPAPLLAAVDREGDEGDAERHRHQAAEIDVARDSGVTRLLDGVQHHRDRKQPEGDVDQEHRAPAHEVREEAAEERTDGGAERGEAIDAADCSRPLLGRERVADHGDAEREHDRSASTLQHTEADDWPRRRGQPADDR
jgi:hypothetical protein